MAVQQNKKSPSRRNMRRAQRSLSTQALATDKLTGDRHVRHHVGANGFYRGKEIIKQPVVEQEETEA